MTYPEAIRYLDSFANFETTPVALAATRPFTLAGILDVLHRLGEPQDTGFNLHVAGSKGKGSTCAALAQVLSQGGCCVGLYTSPHLWDLRERIRILGAGAGSTGDTGLLFNDCISEADFARVMTELRPAFEERTASSAERLTYFEVLTAAAFYYFRQQGVDFSVLETGLGGRLDATNTAKTRVCGIAPISLEHTQILGRTIALIAGEKAGIIKSRDQEVVIGRQPAEALAVFRDRCRQIGCRAVYLGEDFDVTVLGQDVRGQTCRVTGLKRTYEFTTPLLGACQADNMALAVAMAEMALNLKGEELDPEAVAAGMAQTFWPGRFEVIRHGPEVILDCAHTPDALTRTLKTATDVFPGRRIVAVAGFSADKDVAAMAGILRETCVQVVWTSSRHPRAYRCSAAQRPLESGRTSEELAVDVATACARALTKAQRDDIVLVTGSVFVVAEARQRFTTGLQGSRGAAG